MYNNKIKEEFCEYYLQTRIIQKTSLYGFFKKLESYEEEQQKDISKFTKDEALTMYTGLKSRSVYTLMNNNTVLKAYCEWLDSYYRTTTGNVYEQITIDDLKPCVDKNASKLLSKDEIIEIEDQLLNFTDSAIVQCLFEGIAGPSMRDITELNTNMLDKKNKRIVFPDGRILNISDRLCYLLEKAFEEEKYNCYGSSFKVKKLYGKGKLFKERDNAHAADSDDKRFRAVYRKIQVIRNYVGIKELTMKGITASGMAHYLRKYLDETGLKLKEFLQTESGEQLMLRYGYESEFKIDNVTHRFKDLV